MSKAAKEWAARQRVRDGAMKAVLHELAYQHMPGKSLFPSQARLAEAIGRSDRTVREAIRLLQHFGLITKKMRSNGAGGRSSDEFTLHLDKEFEVTKAQVVAARRGLRNRRNLPVGADKSLPAKSSGAPGEIFRGIGSLREGLIQEGTEGRSDTLRGEMPDAATPWPGFKVIAGGRQ